MILDRRMECCTKAVHCNSPIFHENGLEKRSQLTLGNVNTASSISGIQTGLEFISLNIAKVNNTISSSRKRRHRGPRVGERLSSMTAANQHQAQWSVPVLRQALTPNQAGYLDSVRVNSRRVGGIVNVALWASTADTWGDSREQHLIDIRHLPLSRILWNYFKTRACSKTRH